MVAVAVRQGTLGAHGPCCCPAGNTGRGSSRLRSGRERWQRMIAVEARQGTRRADGSRKRGGG